jgi:hypothetical protein
MTSSYSNHSRYCVFRNDTKVNQVSGTSKHAFHGYNNVKPDKTKATVQISLVNHLFHRPTFRKPAIKGIYIPVK